MTQHIDIEVPVIEISDGWAAKDCQTIEECEDAFAVLTATIASIEYQIDIHEADQREDWHWLAKAKCALKYRKAALQIVQKRSGHITKQARKQDQKAIDRLMLDMARLEYPEDFSRWLTAAIDQAGEASA